MTTQPGEDLTGNGTPTRSRTRAAGLLVLVALLAFACWWAFGAHGEPKRSGQTRPAPAPSAPPAKPTIPSPTQGSSPPASAAVSTAPSAASLVPGPPVTTELLNLAAQRAEDFLRVYIADDGTDPSGRLNRLRLLSTSELGGTLRSSVATTTPGAHSVPATIRGRWSHVSEESVILLADVTPATGQQAVPYTLTLVKQGDTWVASALSAGHVGNLGER